MRRVVIGALLLAAPVAVHAMNVAEFLAKAEALEKKGAMALFSKDMGLLKSEVQSAGKAIRAERLAATKAGRTPVACPPADGKAKLDSKELMAHFRAIPPAERGMSVKDGLSGLLAKKYPCRS